MAESPDWSDYNTLLQRYVSACERDNIRLNCVDYQSLAADPLYESVIETVESFPGSSLQTNAERLGFYINVYNLYAIKMVIDHWPLESIKDAGSFFKPVWKKDVGKLDGNVITLHEIEHDILRNMNEPRIHMAIVCASLSCPDLATEAYTADKLEEQLQAATQAFLANPAKGFRQEGDKIVISKIFDWFEEDFEPAVSAFLGQYVELPQASPAIQYMDYDWRLNTQ